MIEDRPALRIGHIKTYIAATRSLLHGKSLLEAEGDVNVRAAFERFLEIISEASRRLPETWKAEHSDVPWRRIADLGNVIRHAYDGVDLPTLWLIYQDEFGPLERAVDAMLVAHPAGDEVR